MEPRGTAEISRGADLVGACHADAIEPSQRAEIWPAVSKIEVEQTVTTERFEATAPDAAHRAAHLTVITSPAPVGALARELEIDESDVIDETAFAAACRRLGRSRAEGYSIVRENIDGEAAAIELARDRLDARIDELSRRAEELERAIGAVDRGAVNPAVMIDLAPVREALVAHSAACAEPDGPHHEALALADEFDAAHALRAHAQRSVESPMLAAAEAELADAHAALALVRAEVGEIDPTLVARVNACHAAVEECVASLEHAKRSDRSAARRALATALEAEQAALDSCGFSAYATFIVQIAQGGNRPEDDARIAEAHRRVTHAEAARRRAEALSAVPSDDEMVDDDVERRARAAQMLGRMAGPEPARELRALRLPGARLDAALDEVVAALRAIDVDPGEHPVTTAERLLIAPPTEAVSSNVDALEIELSRIDEEGARTSDEHDRLTLRLDELEAQRREVAVAPDLTPSTLDADDAETIVRDLLDANAELLVVAAAFDELDDLALERTLALLVEAPGEVVLVSELPVVAMWARGIGAEVVDALPSSTPVLASMIPGEELPAAPTPTEAIVAEVVAEKPEAEAIFAVLVAEEPEGGSTSEEAPEALAEPASAVVAAPPAPPEPPRAAVVPPPARRPNDEFVPNHLPKSSERDDARQERLARSRRRAQRRAEREAKQVRRVASRYSQFSGAVYHETANVPPWAHWDQAAAERRGISDARSARLHADRERHREAVMQRADGVEARTGVAIGDRSVLHSCVYHRSTETRVRCTRCAEPFCDQCLVTVGPKRELICVECAVKAAGVRARRRR
jgi:hypothetical protein